MSTFRITEKTPDSVKYSGLVCGKEIAIRAVSRKLIVDTYSAQGFTPPIDIEEWTVMASRLYSGEERINLGDDMHPFAPWITGRSRVACVNTMINRIENVMQKGDC